MNKKNQKTVTKQNKAEIKNTANKFKTRYFDFYDDVKDPSHKIVDW